MRLSTLASCGGTPEALAKGSIVRKIDSSSTGNHRISGEFSTCLLGKG
jgi:hypothetical protein